VQGMLKKCLRKIMTLDERPRWQDNTSGLNWTISHYM
jgi:hypothetical protein